MHGQCATCPNPGHQIRGSSTIDQSPDILEPRQSESSRKKDVKLLRSGLNVKPPDAQHLRPDLYEPQINLQKGLPNALASPISPSISNSSSFLAMSSSSSSPPSSPTSSLPSKEELKTEVTAATKSTVSSLRSLVAGGVGGVCAVIVGHPFDLVKVRLQTAEKGVYNGAVDVVRRTVAREGLARGLYAGVSAPLVGVTPMFAVSFWVKLQLSRKQHLSLSSSPRAKSQKPTNTIPPPQKQGYDLGQSLIRSLSPNTNSSTPPQQLSTAQISAAGFFSAIPMTLITAPFERVKVLLQIQGQKPLAPGEKPKYAGGLDVVRQLYREGGIRSVYRGSAMTLARDGPGSAAYFATYEVIKRSLTPRDADGNPSGELSTMAVIAGGGAAGVAMWVPVFPVDTVKSRLQSAEGRPTIAGTIAGLYRAGGVRAFFPGIGPAMARAVPANAATFLGMEYAKKVMEKVLGSA